MKQLKYIKHICDRDNLYMVCKWSKKRDCYISVAECFNEEAMDILYRELNK